MFAVQAVVIAGLMIGRTPEYLGKKIERREMQLAMLANLVVPTFVLTLVAVSALLLLGPQASPTRARMVRCAESPSHRASDRQRGPA